MKGVYNIAVIHVYIRNTMEGVYNIGGGRDTVK